MDLGRRSDEYQGIGGARGYGFCERLGIRFRRIHQAVSKCRCAWPMNFAPRALQTSNETTSSWPDSAMGSMGSTSISARPIFRPRMPPSWRYMRYPARKCSNCLAHPHPPRTYSMLTSDAFAPISDDRQLPVFILGSRAVRNQRDDPGVARIGQLYRYRRRALAAAGACLRLGHRRILPAART